MVSTAPAMAKKPRKERAQLSCTFCRHRKLKCDRNQPCQNCVKRSQAAACHFATPQASRIGKPQGLEGTGLQTRIQHLEDLVVSLMSSQDQAGLIKQESAGALAIPHLDEVNKKPAALHVGNGKRAEAGTTEDALHAFGKMSVYGGDTSYVGTEHWVAILDDIAEVKKHINDDEDLVDSPQEHNFADVEGPDLLLGVSRSHTIEDFLAAFPERIEVDRLVSRWLNSPDPLVALIHLPTFELDYQRFWTNPQAAPLTWIGLVYAIMSQACFFQSLTMGPNSDQVTILLEDASTYRQLAAQCLIASDYTKPVRWTIEGLLMYLSNEFTRSTETQMGLWVVLGIVIRLAMRLGYHRDSSHFHQISVFHGEMRRRVWAMLVQLDLLSSVQLGMPRMIRNEQTDTKLPGNYLDTDLSEDMTELPPEKPDTHFTHMSYHIFKGRLTRILANITDEASSTHPPTYERVLQLDKELVDAFKAMPAELQSNVLVQSVTECTSMIIKRINLAMLYHKSICILHRRHITLAKTNERFAYSRAQSMRSAKTILHHQITLFEETQPAGRVYHERWLISGLVTEDFTLAAMVICLNLDTFWSLESPITSYQEEFNDKNVLVYLLERSHNIWNIWRTQPGLATFKASKACQVLSIMIRKIKAANAISEGESSGDPGNPASPTPAITSTPYLGPSSSEVSTAAESLNESFFTPQDVAMDSLTFTNLVPISEWIDMPQDIDWRVWDDMLQPNEAIELPDDVWNFDTSEPGVFENNGAGVR